MAGKLKLQMTAHTCRPTQGKLPHQVSLMDMFAQQRLCQTPTQSSPAVKAVTAMGYIHSGTMPGNLKGQMPAHTCRH
jgi:hypothetical protein